MDNVIPYLTNIITLLNDRVSRQRDLTQHPMIGSFLNGLCAGLGVIASFIIADTVLDIFNS